MHLHGNLNMAGSLLTQWPPPQEKAAVTRIPPRPSLLHKGRKTCPSTSASIPGKYQVVFRREDEKKGFTCQSRRFTSSEINDHPGPGSYTHSSALVDTSGPSFSQSGLGGFASKTERFSKAHRTRLGPASYSPQVNQSRVDHSRGECSNFQQPVVTKAPPPPAGPAPNAYQIDHNWDKCPVAAVASFKSRSKRDPFSVGVGQEQGPAPCHYSVKDDLIRPGVASHCGVFKAKLQRGAYIPDSKVPGPGTYSPFEKGQENEKKLKTRRQHYLCLSAPAVPLPPAPPLPGPGHYEVFGSADAMPTKLPTPSGCKFRSSTTRWSGGHNPQGNIPGPGSYNPSSSAKQSFIYNSTQKWI